MDSIHKTVMVGFPRAFHTDVQNGSKLSKSWVAHTYQSFLLYDRWPACHWAERRQWEKCYPRHARLQWNCFIKSWSVLFAACPEPILRTWPNSDQIHQASVEQERAMCLTRSTSLAWTVTTHEWEWQKERNFCLIKFPLCYCIKKYNSFCALRNGHVCQILHW